MSWPIPHEWIVVEPFTHPHDGEPGVVCYPGPGTMPVLLCWGGTVRSLPRRWRDYRPDPCGLAIARALFTQLTQREASRG